MAMDKLKSWNGKRVATIFRIPTFGTPMPWEITLEHSTRSRSSVRERRARTKKEAIQIAKDWINR